MKLKLSDSRSSVNIIKDIESVDKFFKLRLIDFYKKQYLNYNGCVTCEDGGVLIGDEKGYVGSDEFFK